MSSSCSRCVRGVLPFLVVLLGVARPVDGNTFASAQWGFSMLGDYQSGPGVATIPLQSFDGFGDGTIIGAVSASAHADYLILGSAAAYSTTNSVPTIVTEGLARATAETEDVITPHGLPAGTPGFLVYKATITGTNVNTLSPTNPMDHIGLGGSYVQTGITGYRTTAADASPADGSLPAYDCPAYLDPFTSEQYTDVPVDIVFPIQFETPAGFYLFITSLANVQFDPTVAETFDGASSFADTLTINAVELQDENHQPIPEASITAASGTTYPGVGAATTTTLVASTTTETSATSTTTLPGGSCAGRGGLAHARCLIASAADGPLCADGLPTAPAKAFAAQLSAIGRLLDRAITATGRKQTRLVGTVRHKLAALAARARASGKSKKAARRISPTCEAAVDGLVAAVSADLP